MNYTSISYGHRLPQPTLSQRARLHQHSGGEVFLLIAAAMCFLYSFGLVFRTPLSLIPTIAYLPVFGFVIGLLLYNYKTFILGWMMAGVLATIGADYDIQVGTGDFVTRDMVTNFATFNLGFVNLGLANSALVLAGVFVARYYLPRFQLTFRIFALPLVLLFFTAVQFVLYPQLLTITLSNRAVIVGIFLAVAIAYLPWKREELVKMTKWTIGLITFLCIFYILHITGSRGGRAMWVFALTAIPCAVYLITLRKVWLYLAIIPLMLCAGYIFIFATYWFKLLILTSIGSILILPIIQKNRWLFFIFPIFSILLPLSSLVVEPPDDMGGTAGQLMALRDEGSTIGNLRTYSLAEVWDIVQFKYRMERAGLWQSSLRHTFDPIGLNTIIPDPSVHFMLYSRTGTVGMWLNGPHHGFLWLLRAYGLIAGLAIFGLLNYWVYKVIKEPYPAGPMRWVYQPFLLGFAVIGFHIGDYPLHSGSYLLFAIFGLSLAYLKIFPPVRQRPG
jgi:hypothetical protein